MGIDLAASPHMWRCLWNERSHGFIIREEKSGLRRLFQDQYCFTPDNIKHAAIVLTHWGRVTHICVGKLTIIGSDNGLSPERRQAIIWTNAWILLIGPLGTNFSEILIEIHKFPFKKMHLKTSSAKWRPFCLGLNVLSVIHLSGWVCWLHSQDQHPDPAYSDQLIFS